MSADLITLDEALAHLRLDEHDKCHEGDLIEAYIRASSASIHTYIGAGVYEDEEQTVVREDVKTACKLLVGDLYRNRESESPDRVDSAHGYGYLPHYITALLFPYRDLVIS